MEFSESKHGWISLPAWSRFLIDFGYEWPTDEARPRRIALISMPCDSAGAGLVALGAMVRGLTNPDANDVHGYHEALLRYARQYLESCRSCEMRCEPQEKRCGYSEEASGFVRYKDNKVWEVSELAFGSIWYAHTFPSTERIPVSRAERRWLSPKDAIDWQIDGEAWPQLGDESDPLPIDAYSNLIPTASIVKENLRRSFSGLCLAGRTVGEATTREMYSLIHFRIGGSEHTLTELLTVKGWNTDRRASRITYLNARTETIDRGSYPPSLVVADGDLSFLKVLSFPLFQRSDVIGVIHRAIERDNLEALGNRLNGLRQWYEEDTDLVGHLHQVPMGISVALLKKRFC
ncbi:MAG TPA: hypothetical protein VLL54_12940 [Pyrinomonadaceae bacterium]|nr:hypothetical protein [Pyrinomonadaceae bacterium]